MVFIIGITGVSGAGKSTLARNIRKLLPDSEIITQDSYYKGRMQGQTLEDYLKQNFDDPEVLDLDLLYYHLLQLKLGNDVKIPFFDMGNGFFRQLDHIPISPKKFILIEGLHLFHDKRIRDLIDYKIFIKVPSGIALKQRLKRDHAERNLEYDYTLNIYREVVHNMQMKYVEPVSRYADVVLNLFPDEYTDLNLNLNKKEGRCSNTNTPFEYYEIEHEKLVSEIVSEQEKKSLLQTLPKGSLITVSGLFGAGKSSLLKELCSHQYKRVITYTTREPRKGELRNVDYYYISKESFLLLKERNFFLVTREIMGQHYGMCYLDIIHRVNKGEILVADVLPDVVEELAQKDIPIQIKSLFIKVSIDECTKRMKQRGDNEEVVKSRVDYNKKMLDGLNKSYFTIVKNENFRTASTEIQKRINQNVNKEISSTFVIQKAWRHYQARKAVHTISIAMGKGDVRFFKAIGKAYKYLQNSEHVKINAMFRSNNR